MAAVTEIERIAVLEETYRHIATKADFAEFKADIRSDLVAHQHATQEEFKSVREQQTVMVNDFAEFKADIRADLVAHQQATEAALSGHRHATQEEFKSVREQQTVMANEIAGLKAEFRVIKGLVLVAIGIVIAQFVALWFGLLPLTM